VRISQPSVLQPVDKFEGGLSIFVDPNAKLDFS
jgi:hypothetical protein